MNQSSVASLRIVGFGVSRERCDTVAASLIDALRYALEAVRRSGYRRLDRV